MSLYLLDLYFICYKFNSKHSVQDFEKKTVQNVMVNLKFVSALQMYNVAKTVMHRKGQRKLQS